MRNSRYLQIVGALMTFALLAQAIYACGPFFPNRVLVGGDNVLLKAPVASFRAEIERIKPPVPEHQKAVMPDEKRGQCVGEPQFHQTAEMDVADLESALDAAYVTAKDKVKLLAEYGQARKLLFHYKEKYSHWQNMRIVMEQYEKHGGQPPSYYLESWAKYELNPKSPTPPVYIKPRFPENLPDEFALYMSGATHYHAEELAEAKASWEQLLKLPKAKRQYRSTWAAFMLGKVALLEKQDNAGTFFQQVRVLAKDGFKDSLGLASSSLGWEALAYLRQEKFKQAIDLYLMQHATGDTTALCSLQSASKGAFASPSLDALATDDTSRRVITAYLLSRGGPFFPSPPQEMAKRWLAAVENVKVNQVEEADRLAWAAYQSGDVEQAERWLRVANPESFITHWIQAKLLLRQGKVPEAAEHLRIISRQLPLAEHESVNNKFCRKDKWEMANGPLQEQVRGELGTLLLASQQFSQALDILLKGGHWEDAAYVAERVLTLDELKIYVDRYWREPKGSVPPKMNVGYEESPVWMADRLRYLLARRLTRLGHWKESRPYYPEVLRPRLDAYIQAIQQAHREEVPALPRAAAFWKAAHIARHEGLELLGYELAPDCLVHDGHFPDYSITDARKKGMATNPLTALSEDEERRAETHTPPIDKRWHYRYIAVDHAWRAISLMPDNHDLTAKMLWVAGSWLKDKDPEAADSFYKALVFRCGQTELGQQAGKCHWFPAVEIDEARLLDELAGNQGITP